MEIAQSDVQHLLYSGSGIIQQDDKNSVTKSFGSTGIGSLHNGRDNFHAHKLYNVGIDRLLKRNLLQFFLAWQQVLCLIPVRAAS